MARPTRYRALHADKLSAFGLNPDLIAKSVSHAHAILDEIDDKLVQVNSERLGQIVELANLSAIVGNLFGAGMAMNSNGAFQRNGPHKYPDLLARVKGLRDVEIKVALEKNAPKGHLAKEGLHLVCRYVLVHDDFEYSAERRGCRVAIWEIRFGDLRKRHYNISNTSGDSGKTAVVNAAGMETLTPVYVNMDLCPYSQNSRTYKRYLEVISSS
ncbi:MAG: hypothetical protein IPP83_05990 [Flavobacteriales bacterium]|nr:hypothetical protein [Flavobacteriales bacterium]